MGCRLSGLGDGMGVNTRDLNHIRKREALRILASYEQPITVQIEGRRGRSLQYHRTSDCSTQTERHWDPLHTLTITHTPYSDRSYYSHMTLPGEHGDRGRYEFLPNVPRDLEDLHTVHTHDPELTGRGPPGQSCLIGCCNTNLEEPSSFQSQTEDEDYMLEKTMGYLPLHHELDSGLGWTDGSFHQGELSGVETEEGLEECHAHLGGGGGGGGGGSPSSESFISSELSDSGFYSVSTGEFLRFQRLLEKRMRLYNARLHHQGELRDPQKSHRELEAIPEAQPESGCQAGPPRGLFRVSSVQFGKTERPCLSRHSSSSGALYTPLTPLSALSTCSTPSSQRRPPPAHTSSSSTGLLRRSRTLHHRPPQVEHRRRASHPASPNYCLTLQGYGHHTQHQLPEDPEEEHGNRAGHHANQNTLHVNQTTLHVNQASHHVNQVTHHTNPVTHHASQTSHHAIQTSHHANQTNQTTLNANLATHHANQTSHHVNHQTIHANQANHHANQASHHANQASHHANQASHHVNHQTIHANQASHHANQASHHANQTSHHVNHQTLHGNQATLHANHPHPVDYATLHANQLTHSADYATHHANHPAHNHPHHPHHTLPAQHAQHAQRPKHAVSQPSLTSSFEDPHWDLPHPGHLPHLPREPRRHGNSTSGGRSPDAPTPSAARYHTLSHTPSQELHDTWPKPSPAGPYSTLEGHVSTACSNPNPSSAPANASANPHPRTVRNQLLRERALRLADERSGMSTDEESHCEVRTGRYWSRTERREHVLQRRARGGGGASQGGGAGSMQGGGANALLELSHRKLSRLRNRKLLDDWTTVEELLTHGNRMTTGDDTHTLHNSLLTVTTV